MVKTPGSLDPEAPLRGQRRKQRRKQRQAVDVTGWLGGTLAPAAPARPWTMVTPILKLDLWLNMSFECRSNLLYLLEYSGNKLDHCIISVEVSWILKL